MYLPDSKTSPVSAIHGAKQQGLSPLSCELWQIMMQFMDEGKNISTA